MPKKREAEFPPEYVRDVSEAVYKLRLEQDSKGAVERMLENDGDGGGLLRSRAGAYDTMTRAYLKVLKSA